MYAPVDQSAAACNGLGSESAAQTRDGAMCAEADIHVENFAELAGINIFLDGIHSVVEAVDHADIQDASGFMLNLLHLGSFGKGACRGFFTEHILARAHGVNSNLGMHVVGGADGHSLDLGVVQNHMIVRDSLCAGCAVLLKGSLCLFGNQVAEIDELRLGICRIRGQVSRIGDGSASDNTYFHINTVLSFSGLTLGSL